MIDGTTEIKNAPEPAKNNESESTKRNAPEPTTNNEPESAEKKLRGLRKGTKLSFISKEIWFTLCSDYVNNYAENMSQTNFLKSSVSGDLVNIKHKMSFSRNVKKFKKGLLKPSPGARDKKSKYPVIEKKLIEYINMRLELFKTDRIGLSWIAIGEKCKVWADMEGEEYKDF